MDLTSLTPFALKFMADLREEERNRAVRLVRECDRVQYIVCRTVLRRLLAGYCGEVARGIRFTYSPWGKPFIPAEENPTGMRFNLSHSGGVAAIALTRGREVGVDIERVRPLSELDDLVRQNFAPEEQADFENLPEPNRLRAFFATWVRKEAFVKATGDGLSRSLASFRVPVVGSCPVLQVGGDEHAAGWTVHDLECEEGYAAAVSFRGAGAVVLAREWTSAVMGEGMD